MIGRLFHRYSAWIWLVIALTVVGVLTTIASGGQGEDRPLAVDNARPDGGLALYLWLQRSGYQVHSRGDVTLPGADSPRKTALILAPQRELARAEQRRLLDWVRSGGQLVVGTDGTAVGMMRRFGIRVVPAPAEPVRITQPLLLAPPASRLSAPADLVGEDLNPPGQVAATADGPVLVRRTVGRGVVWLLTAPQLLDNELINRQDNRRLALNLAGPAGSRLQFIELGPVGSSASAGDWLTGTAWGVAFLFALLVILLHRWLGGWRLGPPVIPFAERRRPAVEYIISLADLLRRGRKRDEILGIYQRTLRQDLARRYGTTDPGQLPAPLRGQVESSLAPPASLTEEQLISRVQHVLECEEEVRRARV